MLLALVTLLLPADDARWDALAHYGAGRLLAATDRPASAARELEAAAAADPAAPDPKRDLVGVYADLGRDAAAVRVARDVLAADPHDWPTARRLGRLLFDGKRYKDAAAALMQAADSPRLDPRPAERRAILRECGTALLEAGDAAGAVRAVQRAALLPGADGGLHEQLGAALTAAGQFADADAAYRDAARLHAAAGDPTRAATLGWHRAEVLAAAGRPADAVAAMDLFLALKPTTLRPYTDYAGWLRAAGRGADAPARLARLADGVPSEPRIRWVAAAETARQDPAAGERLFRPLLDGSADPALWGLFAGAFAAAGRPEVVVAELNRLSPPDTGDADPAAGDRLRALVAAVKAEPLLTSQLLALAPAARDWPADTWGLVGFLAERAGRTGDAEAALRQGLRAGDNDLFAPLYDLLGRQRKWAAQAALCRDLVGRPVGPGGRRKGPPLLSYFLALPLAELGDAAGALRAIEEAVTNAARPFAMRLAKAEVLGALGRHREALAEVEAVAADAASPAEARQVRLARAHAHQGLHDLAAGERELRALLEDDPDDARVLNDLGYHLADEGRNLAEAEAMVRRAVELDRAEQAKAGRPEGVRGTYLDSLGWVLFKRDDLTGAKAALEAAAGASDGAADPVTWDHLGDVRYRLGDRAGAKAAWERADAGYTGSRQARDGGRQREVRRKLRRVG